MDTQRACMAIIAGYSSASDILASVSDGNFKASDLRLEMQEDIPKQGEVETNLLLRQILYHQCLTFTLHVCSNEARAISMPADDGRLILSTWRG